MFWLPILESSQAVMSPQKRLTCQSLQSLRDSLQASQIVQWRYILEHLLDDIVWEYFQGHMCRLPIAAVFRHLG